MKTNNKSKIIAALGVIACLVPTVGPAQIPAVSPSNQTAWRDAQEMRVADSSSMPGENVNDYIDKKIVGPQQQELGTVKDFLLQARSGRIAFIVVAAPKAGDELRLLPPNALQSANSGSDFTTQMNEAAFQAAPTVSQQNLESGQLPANPTGYRWGNRSEQLIRASQLTGKLVSAGGQEAGAIDEVGIDLPNGTASVLFRTNPHFAGAESRFEVPLNRFEFGSGEQLSTRLTRADFAQVQGSNISVGDTQPSTTAATPPSPPQPTASVWPGSALNPTGRDSFPSDEATNHAAAIRSAIAADPHLVRENISVYAADQKVVLRGRVSSEAVKSRVETLARAYAGGVAVDNALRAGR